MTVPRTFRMLCAAVLATVLFAAGSVRSSAQNTLTESDRKRILDRLENLHKTTLEVKFGRYANALTAFQAAAETPAKSYDFYLECVKLVEFDKPGKKFSEYRDWKERNIKRVRATEHQKMLQFQLRYLVMTIRALHMKDRVEIIPQLQTFLQEVVEEHESMEDAARGLKRSVTGTIFAQAYEIELASPKSGSLGWEMAPLNLQGHFENLILLALRETGDTKGLEAAWNRRINWEITLMSPEEDESVKSDFVTKDLPQFHWDKWVDIAENGERARAAKAMLALIEGNLQHPDAETWIATLINTVRAGTVTDADFETVDETGTPIEAPAPDSVPAAVTEPEE